MKTINSIEQLRDLIANCDGCYIRWSRGPRYDRKPSRDYANGGSHAGLSAVAVSPEWAGDDAWMARRVLEYRFLRLKDERIGCYIYRGEQVGTDSDGYDSIRLVEPVAKLGEALISTLLEIRR